MWPRRGFAMSDSVGSGSTEFCSNKAGTSTQPFSWKILNPTFPLNAEYKSESSSDPDSNYETSSDESDSEYNDFQNKEGTRISRRNYRSMKFYHKQGINPRKILPKFFRSRAFSVPENISDSELWARMKDFAKQPWVPDINSIDHASHLLSTCKNIIVVTGAGVSVSCGIPDFRSLSSISTPFCDGLRLYANPKEIFDIGFFKKDSRTFFTYAKELYPGSFTPSLCHRFIRLLERKERLLRNYSENIDALERIVGIEKVVECHGSFATASCTKCGIIVTAEEIREDVLKERIPMCSICNPVSSSSSSNDSSTVNQSKRISHCASTTEVWNDLYEMGILKPDIVFFGEWFENLKSFYPAIGADRYHCDCLLVIGTSLKERPVSLIPKFLNDDIPRILINRKRLKHYTFSVELLGDADEIVDQICRKIGGDWTEICEQPQLKLSSTLQFNPETAETVSFPFPKPTSKTVNSAEYNAMRPDRVHSPSVPLPTELDVEQYSNDLSTHSKEEPTASRSKNDEPAHSKKESSASDAVEGTDNGKIKTTDEDRDGIFKEEADDEEISFDDEENDSDDDDDEEEEEEEEDDNDEECDEDECETESSTSHDENSDSSDGVDERSTLNASAVLLMGKRVGTPDIAESGVPGKQLKKNE